MNPSTAETTTTPSPISASVETAAEKVEDSYPADSPIIQDLATALLQQFGRGGCGVLTVRVGNG